jgi:predicted ABC-type ATPase
MAGSPGSGKTEFSRNLIKIIEEGRECRVVRIDSDEIRELIPEYTGNNSYLFQMATTLIVEKMHDYVLQQSQNFILDGTLWKYEKATENINRSLQKNRPVFIFYNYQKPEVAWRFTQAREELEGRNIKKSVFIDQFLGARETIQKISDELGNQITNFFVKKDIEKNTIEDMVKIEPKVTRIDDYIQVDYTKDVLEKIL